MANTNGFDYFKLGEPIQELSGKIDTSGLDYFKLGEPFPAIVSAGTTPPPAVTHNQFLALLGVGY